MTENQRLQIESLNEIKTYFYKTFVNTTTLIPEGTELCILLRTHVDYYIANEFLSTKTEIPNFLESIKEALINNQCDIERIVQAIDLLDGRLRRGSKVEILYEIACLLISEYSREFHPNADSDRDISFMEFQRHVYNTFDDKYEKSIVNPLLYMLTEYGYGHTMICVIKYVSRYFATDGRKTHNVKDLLKAAHYIVLELTRLKSLAQT